MLLAWNLSTGQLPQSVKAHDPVVTAVAYGPYDNGPILTAGGDAMIRVWDTNSLQCLRSVRNQGGIVNFIGVEPQHRFFTLDSGGWLRSWTLVDNQKGRPGTPRTTSRSVSPAASANGSRRDTYAGTPATTPANSRPATPRTGRITPTQPATPRAIKVV